MLRQDMGQMRKATNEEIKKGARLYFCSTVSGGSGWGTVVDAKEGYPLVRMEFGRIGRPNIHYVGRASLYALRERVIFRYSPKNKVVHALFVDREKQLAGVDMVLCCRSDLGINEEVYAPFKPTWQKTKPCPPHLYSGLLSKLESTGYQLRVKKRV